MAIYRCEAKIVSRRVKDRAGKTVPGKQVSVVAKAAYRSGTDLRDELQGRTHCYSNRVAEVAHSEIMCPPGAPSFMGDREALWNTVERCERRSDSQLAREWIISLPRELTEEQNIELVRGWIGEQFVEKGFVCDWSYHRGKGNQPHVHALQAMRPVEEGTEHGFGKKPQMDGKFNGRGSVGFGAKGELVAMRENWEWHVNLALELAGRAERVDHRSLADQGISRPPEPKIGIAAIALQRKGIVADPERVKIVRWARMEKALHSMIHSVRETGEVRQHDGQTWWQRVQHASEWAQDRGEWLKEQAVALAKDEKSGGSWQDYVKGRREAEPERESVPER